MKFTKSSLLLKIYLTKEFKKFRQYMICPTSIRHLMLIYPMKWLKLFYPPDASSIADALNKMKDKVNDKTLDYIELSKKTGYFSFMVDKDKPYVMVAPGGGYNDVCSFVEGFTTAIRLNELGYNAFICRYRTGKDALFPNPIEDMVAIYKDIQKRYQVKDEEYGVCGFSAGGHLVGCMALNDVGFKHYGIKNPSFVILCYPVISLTKFVPSQKRKQILGKNFTDEMVHKLSIDENVTSDYPKTYIWQCKDDKTVDSENSMMMKEALDKAGVKSKLELFDDDRHGLGIGTNSPAEGWLDRAIEFWKDD